MWRSRWAAGDRIGDRMPGEKSESAETPAAVVRRRRRWLPRLALAVIVPALVAGGWVAVRAAIATNELAALESELVSSGAGDSSQAASSETLAAVLSRLPEFAERTTTARSLVGDPVWMIAEQLPFAGVRLRTLRVVAEQSDALVSETAVPLVAAFTADEGELLTGAAIDVDAVRRIATALDQAGDRVAASHDALLALEDDAGKQARRGVDLLLSAVSAADETLGPLRVLTAAAPSLLGEEGRRDYLVLFLTPAELRSGGGLPGAAAMVEFENGAALPSEVYSTQDYRPEPSAPVVPLTPTELALYGDRPARLLQDTTATDDFSRTARFAGALTELHKGVSPAGVLSIDILAIGYLLEATGPVVLEDGTTISAENSAELLMNAVYLRYPRPEDQDAYFAMITQRVLEAVRAGAPDPSLLASAVVRGVQEQRIQAWSSDDRVQAALVSLGAGDGPAAQDRSVVGVHLNDRTRAKMDYFLDAGAEILWTECSDGRRLDHVRVTLQNRFEVADLVGVPWYITGDGSVVPKGQIATQVVVMGAVGARIVGDPGAELTARDEADRPRVAWTAVVAPGEQASRTVILESSDGAGAPVIDSTPAVAVDVRESPAPAAGPCKAGG